MKFFAVAPALLACVASFAMVNAGPVAVDYSELSTRDINTAVSLMDALYARGIDAEDFLDDVLERRGGVLSKSSKKDSKAKYSVGKNRPETPTGEFRKFTAGRHDDYFGDWQTMTGGKGKSAVKNPAAGKGKKGRR